MLNIVRWWSMKAQKVINSPYAWNIYKHLIKISLNKDYLSKRMEKKLDSNYTRMPWAILNKSWRQHPTKQQLYRHLPPITKTINIRRTRHAGHCWRSRDKLISDVLQWTPSHGRAKAGRPPWTYIQQLCRYGM